MKAGADPSRFGGSAGDVEAAAGVTHADASSPDAWNAAWHVAADHPAFAGHFPGQPLLPGVLLVAHALEALQQVPALAARLGTAPRLAHAKFLAPVRPGDRLALRLTADASRIGFAWWRGDTAVATGQFACAADRIEPMVDCHAAGFAGSTGCAVGAPSIERAAPGDRARPLDRTASAGTTT